MAEVYQKDVIEEGNEENMSAKGPLNRHVDIECEVVVTGGKDEENNQRVEHTNGQKDPVDKDDDTMLDLKQRVWSFLNPPVLGSICGMKIPKPTKHMVFQTLLLIFLVWEV